MTCSPSDLRRSVLGTIDDVYMTFPASTGTTLSSRVIKLHPAIRAREQMALVDELRSAANYHHRRVRSPRTLVIVTGGGTLVGEVHLLL